MLRPMTMPLTLITGASRGLGRAVAEQALAQGHQVIGLSRRPPADLSSPRFLHWAVELADARAAAAQLAAWLAEQGPRPWSSATLINNAGVVSRPAPLADSDADDLANAIRVGLEAPLLLSAAFLHATRGWPLPRKLLLVSSGLGRRPMAGSVSYCAAKAGLDHLARALALEEAARPDGARVVSLAPGVIDTDMQQQLRGADPQAFPERTRFAELHAGGQLDSPAAAAAKLLRYLDRADFGSNPVADVRDA